MIRLRPFRSGDLDSLYAISLATGHVGGDASALYTDGRMIGHIYSAPYACLCPELAFVAEDAAGAGGFILGCADTRAFEDRLERDWWPALRARYPDPGARPLPGWTADQRRAHMIHHTRRAPEAVVAAFPAHLHMNLLPRLQGQGHGRSLLALWLGAAGQLGASGVHAVPNPQNLRAIRFWETCGFSRIEAGPAGGVCLGMTLPGGG